MVLGTIANPDLEMGEDFRTFALHELSTESATRDLTGTTDVGGFYGHRLWDAYGAPFSTTDGWSYEDTGGTCSTVDCHYNTTTYDGWHAGAVTMTCTYCHNTGANSGALADAHVGSGQHAGHIANSSFVTNCTECHGASDGSHSGHWPGSTV